jgi:hypothetical protein
MYTTTQIYDALKNLKTNVLSSTKYGTTTSIFGITGTFEPTAQLNDYCGSNDECFSGWCGDDSYGCYITCDRLCTTGEVGQPCTNGGNCSSGYCDAANSYACTDGSIGSGCGSDSDCVSGKCAYDDVNWNFFQCTDGASGSVCANNADCSSPNICDMGTNTCVDGSNGAACTSSLGCSSGYCDSVNDICSSGVPGSACGGNSECDTYNCVSNICSADLPLITSGLVGYWPLNETSGTTAGDFSGNNYNGTSTGGVLVNQTGKIGKAYEFDGADDSVGTSPTGSVSATSSVTISAWVKADGGEFARVVQTVVNTNDTELALEYNRSNHEWSMSVGKAGITSVYAADTSSATPGEWYYVVGTFDGSNMKLFVNGVYKSVTAVNETILTASPVNRGWSFGSMRFNGGDIYLFSGSVDEVAIWNRLLAPAEITNLYNGGAGMSIITP